MEIKGAFSETIVLHRKCHLLAASRGFEIVVALSVCRFGASFAASGGGVFATLWDGNGVQTWFWPVGSIIL